MAASYCLQFGVHTVTQSSPSSTISCTQNAPHIADISRITSADSVHGHSGSSSHASTVSRVLKDVHISARLMEDFLALAEDNTNKDLETCGVLGAFLRGGIFYVTTLIIPKQESSSNSCQALNEEEIFFLQNEQSLFPVGWIHTHPSQSCFMSSIDLHTQFSYQVMVPEAVAIVMAPTDTTRPDSSENITARIYNLHVKRNAQFQGTYISVLGNCLRVSTGSSWCLKRTI